MIYVLLPISLGRDRPTERDLHSLVTVEVADKWRTIGYELLHDISTHELNIIESDCQNVC